MQTQVCGDKTQSSGVFDAFNQDLKSLQTINKEEVHSAEDLSLSAITSNAEQIFAQQAQIFRQKTEISLISLKNDLAGKYFEIETRNKDKERLNLIIKNLKEENKALKRRLDRHQEQPKNIDQLQKSIDQISTKFKDLEGTLEGQKMEFDTTSVEDSRLKSREFHQAWSSDNKELKYLAKEIESLFAAHAANSKAHDSETLCDLNKSWSAVCTSDYKLEKSKQHLALKLMLKEFLTKLEDSHKELAAEVSHLTENKFKAPGVTSNILSWYIVPEQKNVFESDLKGKIEKFEELHTIAQKQEKEFDKVAARFSLLEDQSVYSRRLAAGNETLSLENIQAFEKIRNDLNKEKQTLYAQLVKKWEEFNTVHVNLCTQIAVLENGLAAKDLTFPWEKNAILNKEKLLSVKAATLL